MNTPKMETLLKFPTQKTKVTLYKIPKSDYIYYYFRYDNKTYRGSTGELTIDGASDKTRDIILLLINGKQPTPRRKTDNNQRDKIYVADVLDFYIQRCRNVGLKDKTVKSYISFAKYIKEWGGALSFEDTMFRNLAFIDNYQEYRRTYHTTHLRQREYLRNGKMVKGKRPKPLGVITINSEAKLLVAAINEAKKHYLEGDKIMPTVDVYYKPLKDKIRKADNDNFTKDEYNRFKEELAKIDPLLGLLLSFGVRTAIRYPGEFMNITMKDLDFNGKRVYIRDRKNTKGEGYVDTAIPMSPAIMNILLKVIDRPIIDKTNPKQPIWIYDNGNPMKYIHARWKRAMKAAGVEKHIYPYHMRAIGITRMLKLDIPIAIITYISGHTDDSAMIFKHYNKMNRDDVQTAIFEVEEKISAHRKEQRKKGESNIQFL